jgi:IS5 family transposase
MEILSEYLVASKLIEQVPNSDFAIFLDKAFKFLEFAPEILDRIEDDLDLKGKIKKVVRLEDRFFVLEKLAVLPGFDYEGRNAPVADDLILESGRPRMDAMFVYLLLQIQGYRGSLTNQQNMDFLRESITFANILQNHGWKFPSRSTINENLNKVSLQTHQYILDKQIEFILGLNLDDFKELTIDSTSVSADSKWPTDSGIILESVQRSFRLSQRLHKFGLDNFREFHVPRFLKEIKQLDFQINCQSGKRKKLNRPYKKLLGKAEKSAKHFVRELEHWKSKTDLQGLLPSKRTQVEWVIDRITKDTENIFRTIQNTHKRLFENKYVPAKDKVLSISDPDAAFIKKGGREPVVGYKPQLVRSKQGFIAELVLPWGNASDSGQLVPVIEKTIEKTSVLPDLVNADDGYASTMARQHLQNEGIETVNISGAKGKRIISEEDWDSDIYREARRNRSAVESLMSIMKGCFGFGRMTVRGLDNVYRSMLQKALAYNLVRCIYRIEQSLKVT